MDLQTSTKKRNQIQDQGIVINIEEVNIEGMKRASIKHKPLLLLLPFIINLHLNLEINLILIPIPNQSQRTVKRKTIVVV